MLKAIQRWANDDLRSLNGQIEFLLRQALEQSGRERPKYEVPSDAAGKENKIA